MSLTPNAVKYTSTPLPHSTLVGNVAFGWDGYDYGPSNISGWNNGITPPSGGYAIYATSASQVISTTVADNDDDLLIIAHEFTNLTFTSASQAQSYLNSHGYAVVNQIYSASIVTRSLQLYLDAGDSLSYPGTGSVWTDLIQSRVFNLLNGVSYNSNNGGYLSFSPTSSQYAGCISSLPSMSTWTVEAWHYYTGNNAGIGMCLVTEVYPGNTGNINYALGDDNGNAGNSISSGFFDGGWRTTNNYALTPNNWYYIVGTYDGFTNKLYVDGNLVASGSYTGTSISSQGGINLMRRWDNPDYWGGGLGIVRIYNADLSSGEIEQNFNANRTRFGL